MDNQLVLIADSDTKNLQILKDNLQASGFLVITVTNGTDAWDEIQRTPPKLILTETNLPGISGYQLLERLKSDPNTSSIPLIFLTKQREVQQRIRAFEMGAKDYLVKPLHVKEVIAHIRMVMRRLKKRKIDQLEAHKRFSGRLDQLNLADLIESFGVERKTGILTLSNGTRTGQVYFREGSVVNASLGDFKTEQAVYQMFPWNRGYFNMLFREVDVSDDISISNLGLLLEGIKRLEIREKLMKQLPSPETAFVVTPTFKSLINKKKVGNGAGEFVELLDGKHTVEQIIDKSNLDDLIALKRIVRLYQQGFIKPTIAAVKKPVGEQKIITKEAKVKFITDAERDALQDAKQVSPAEPQETDSKTHADEALIRKIAESKDKIDAETAKQTPTPTEEQKFDEIPPEVDEDHLPPAEKETKTISLELDQLPPAFREEIHKDNVFNLKPPKLTQEEEITFPKEEDTSPSTEADFPTEDKSSSKTEEPIADDNIFQLRPNRHHDELEEEIRPLIERIEHEKHASQEADKAPEKAKEEPLKPEIPEAAFVDHQDAIPPTPLDDGITEETEKTFIDEELLRKSTEAKAVADPIIPEKNEKTKHAEQAKPTSEKGTVYETSRRANRIMLISVDDDCKDEIMDILTNDNFKSMTIPEAGDLHIDFGKINLAGYNSYTLVSASVEKNLDPFLESTKSRIVGNIFTFDCSRSETWEYTNYLIHSIGHKFRIPYVIAVMNFHEQNSLTMDVIRYKLNLKSDTPLIVWDEKDRSTANKLLASITKSDEPELENEPDLLETIVEKVPTSA